MRKGLLSQQATCRVTKVTLSSFLLRYPHLLEAKMVSCTQANRTLYGLFYFGRQNAGETILQHANQIPQSGTGPARLAFVRAKGFTVDWLSCRSSLSGAP